MHYSLYELPGTPSNTLRTVADGYDSLKVTELEAELAATQRVQRGLEQQKLDLERELQRAKELEPASARSKTRGGFRF